MRFYLTVLGLATTISCGHRMLGEENARQSLARALGDTAHNVAYTLDRGDPVQDKETATKLAEAILFKTFGEKKIKDERPYEIYNIDGYWIMKGTLPNGYDGGTFEIIFEAESRKIFRLKHYR